MTFDVLRARRRWLLGLIVPVLLSSWVGAAALPCAAMDVAGDHEAGHVMTEHATVDGAHDAHEGTHHSAQTASHPACPHCAHKRDGSGSDDAAAHAGCGDSPASPSNDSRRLPDKPDLSAVVPVASQPVGAARAADVRARLDSYAIPPPARPLYLEHCVFLN